MQSYFVVPKLIRINSMHCFIMKILNKWELQHIACNDSSGVDLKNFINVFKKYFAKPYSF